VVSRADGWQGMLARALTARLRGRPAIHLAMKSVTARISRRGPVAAVGIAEGRSDARALSPVGELIRLVEGA
jgi:hypothetical protein